MSDTMLLGILRMPFEIAMSTPTAQIQYHQRGVQAADEIEKMSAEIARLHKAHQAACEGGDLLRAHNARLRAQVSEYFTEPATHPLEET